MDEKRVRRLSENLYMDARVETRDILLILSSVNKKKFFSTSGFIEKFVSFVIFGFLLITQGFSQCTWYQDGDGDGFGRSDVFTTIPCTDPAPMGFVLNKLDCNDNSSNNQVWTTLGGVSISGGAVTATEIAVGPTGNPVTLFRNYTAIAATVPMTAKRYNGSWTVLGNDPIGNYMYGADIEIDGNDVSYIAYLDYDPLDNNNNRATVMKYDGTSWVLVGSRRFSDILSTGGDVKVDITLDKNNVPYVSIVNAAMQVEVMKYDVGTGNWILVGPAPFASAGLPETSIAIDDSGVPYVAFAENSDGKISVMKYNGAWVVVGSASFSNNDVLFPSISIDGTGNPYVAYFDQGLEVVVQKYNSTITAWEKVGISVYAGNSSSISFTINRDNVPHVAYSDDTQKISVRKWNGAAWQVVGTSQFSTGVDISLTIGDNDNIPYVSFRDSNDGDKAKVKSITPAPLLPTVPTLATTQTTICAGETVTLSINSGSLNDAVQWQWYTASCGGTSLGTGTSINASPVTTTTYYARGEGSCVSSPGSCATISITVNPLPVINTQPSATVAVCEGLNTSISLSTSGANLANQWYVDRNDGNGWTSLLNETAATLNLISVPFSMNNYQYEAIVTNTVTLCKSTSTASVLTVNTLPTITGQPLTSSTLCETATLNLAVTALGGTLTHQWYQNNGSGWSVLPAEVSNTLSLQGVTFSMNSYQYRVLITNSTTNCTSLSNASALYVNTPPLITVQPQPVTICSGSNTSFNATSSGTNLTYQWQQNTGSGWSDLTGETTISLSLNGTSASFDGYQYRMKASNIGCAAANSQAALLTVNTPPSITANPISQTICSGGYVSFNAASSGTNLNYQWQRDTGSGWNDIAGETTTSLNINAATAVADGYQYRIVVSNVTCSAATSQPALLTVRTSPSITSDPLSQTVCSGGNILFSSSATGTGLSYQWQRNTGSGWNNIAGEAAPDLLLQNIDASFQGYTYRVVISNSVCPVVYSQSAGINVSTSPQLTNPVNVAVCENSNASFLVGANNSAASYQWQQNTGSNWQNITGETNQTLILQNVAFTMDQYRYRVIVNVPACNQVISTEAALSVSQTPRITSQPVSLSICEDENAIFTVQASGTTIQYQWQVNEGSNWTDLAGEQNQVLTINDVTMELVRNRYRATISSSLCGQIVSGEASISIDKVACSKELLITEGLSPNGDKNFDYWYIQGIDQYPENTVKIFNVWGDLIFETAGYNNEERIWQGQSDKSFAGSSHAPDGTYFYIIDLGVNASPLRGFVVLKR